MTGPRHNGSVDLWMSKRRHDNEAAARKDAWGVLHRWQEDVNEKQDILLREIWREVFDDIASWAAHELVEVLPKKIFIQARSIQCIREIGKAHTPSLWDLKYTAQRQAAPPDHSHFMPPKGQQAISWTAELPRLGHSIPSVTGVLVTSRVKYLTSADSQIFKKVGITSQIQAPSNG